MSDHASKRSHTKSSNRTMRGVKGLRKNVKKLAPVDDGVKREIINITNAVRKKHMQLKLGRSSEDELLRKMYNPVTEPLRKIVDATTTALNKDVIKSEPIKKEERSTSPIAEKTVEVAKPLRKTTSTIIRQPDFLEDENVFIHSPESSVARSSHPIDNSFQQLYQSMSETRPGVIDEFLENFNPLPRNYIDGLFRDTSNTYDTTYGVTYEADVNRLMLGSKVITFDEDDIVIENKRYKGSEGLYELIFKSNPEGYSNDDLNQYHDILEHTNVHHRDFDGMKQLRGSAGTKWKRVIKPIIFKKRAPKSWSGRGTSMFVRNDPYQYVYWDDVNELVDRLRLLVASENAGHTNHNNEIVSIIEELREAGVIE